MAKGYNIGTLKSISSIVAVKYIYGTVCVCVRPYILYDTCVLTSSSVTVCSTERLGISVRKHWREDTGEKAEHPQ